MALTTGSPLPDVTTTTTQATAAPAYYTDYLTDLAKAGQTAVGTDPTKMVAGFSNLQQQAFTGLPQATTGYLPQLGVAKTTAADVAAGVSPQDIGQFINPYIPNVINEMARQSQLNVQRNVLPQLKGMFTSTGGLGSQRMLGATGQMLGDIEANLLGAQTGALQKGYSDAVAAALQEQQLRERAGELQTTQAEQEQRQALAGTKAMLDAGALQQAQKQAEIEAPLKMAANAAALMRGYQIPTTTTQTFKGPMPGAYGASPLQTLVGLGSLFASGSGGTSAASGLGSALKYIYDKITTPGATTTDASINPSTADLINANQMMSDLGF